MVGIRMFSQDQIKVGITRLFCVFVVPCLVGESAWGASFDCRPYAKARACPENVICATADLSQMDEQLADRYGYLIKSSRSSAAANLRDEQRRWLQQRHRCGCDASCISRLYTRRLDELARPVGGEVSQFVSHWTCSSDGPGPTRYALKITEEFSVDQHGSRVLHNGSIDLVAKSSSIDSENFERGVPERLSIIRTETECAKYGWTAENDDYIAKFCGATQGVGDLEVRPRGVKQPILRADCDSADVE